jgi:hypothetical protein
VVSFTAPLGRCAKRMVRGWHVPFCNAVLFLYDAGISVKGIPHAPSKLPCSDFSINHLCGGPSGEIVQAELHWYEATGIGKREMKIKAFI